MSSGAAKGYLTFWIFSLEQHIPVLTRALTEPFLHLYQRLHHSLLTPVDVRMRTHSFCTHFLAIYILCTLAKDCYNHRFWGSMLICRAFDVQFGQINSPINLFKRDTCIINHCCVTVLQSTGIFLSLFITCILRFDALAQTSILSFSQIECFLHVLSLLVQAIDSCLRFFFDAFARKFRLFQSELN